MLSFLDNASSKTSISHRMKRVLTAILVVFTTSPLFAADSNEISSAGVFFSWFIALGGGIAALVFAYRFFKWMVEQDEGDELMVKIAQHVRDGADAYLWRQYRVVAIFFAIVSLLLIVVSTVFHALSSIVPIAFLSGGFFSALAGWCGMKTATLASSRTAQACKTSLNGGLQIAFRSGAVMGLTVVGLGLIDICMWFAVLYWIFPCSVRR